MILFYCSFLALKAHSPRTFNMNPDEFRVVGEKLLFQAYVCAGSMRRRIIMWLRADRARQPRLTGRAAPNAGKSSTTASSTA